MLKLVHALHEDPDLLYCRANVYLAKGCLDIAESLYCRLLSINETEPQITRELQADIFHNLGMICERRHNLEAAIKYYKQSVQHDRQRSMTWLFLARIYLEKYEHFGNKQDYQAGIKALNKAAEFKPDYPVIKFLKTKYASIN